MPAVGKIAGAAFGDGREAVAQRVVEDQISLRTKSQHTGCLARPVAPGGKVPVGIRESLEVRRARRVGEAEDQVSGPIDNLDAGHENEPGRQSGIAHGKET